MEFFSSWLKNIVFISITVTLIHLILPESMAKYVKVITGFIIMLVMVQPLAELLHSDVYFDNLYIKHTTVMGDSVIDSEEISSKRENQTVKVYREKLESNIKSKIEDTLKIKADISLDINEDMDEESFGTLKKARVRVLEEPEKGLNINIKKVEIGTKEAAPQDDIDKKTRNKLNNFFLNFYNLEAENITISKNE